MMRRRLLVACTAAAAIVLVSRTPVVRACGPFFEQAIFTFAGHPDFPLERFAAGEVGIPQSTWARSYLVVAYRVLNGMPLDSAWRQASLDVWHRRTMADPTYIPDEQAAADLWNQQRTRVLRASEAPPAELEWFRAVPASSYAVYVNCNGDAMRRAVSTLDSLIKAHGASHAAVTDWVRAQDVVFSNCHEGRMTPPPAAADAPLDVQSARAYQIAAADFHGERFAEAEREFREIGADAQSPWRTLSRYLVIRTIIRHATLSSADGADRPELERANAEILAVLADPSMADLHAATDRLRGFVAFRLDPERRMRELAAFLSRSTPASDSQLIQHALIDYTLLFDKAVGSDPVQDPNRLSDGLRTDDLTDWIATFQSATPSARAHARSRWEATKSVPWLVAALSKLQPTDEGTADLLSAARQIRWGSPAYPSVAYDLARFDIESGRMDQARASIDAIGVTRLSALPRSAANRFWTLRMRVADSLEEFLRFAPRLPAGSTNESENHDNAFDAQDSQVSQIPGGMVFDTDASDALNALPLNLLARAANAPTLTAHLRVRLARAAWTKAIVVGRMDVAAALAPALAASGAPSRSDLDTFVASTTADDRSLQALTILLRNPGLNPLVAAGLERETGTGRIDDYRRNWWCAAQRAVWPASRFTTAAARSTASAEYSTLMKIGAAPNYFGQEAVRLAKLRPDDPRSPEVLALAVKASRYGCGDADTGDASRAAFELLHRKYPNTSWAKQTPFWYK